MRVCVYVFSHFNRLLYGLDGNAEGNVGWCDRIRKKYLSWNVFGSTILLFILSKYYRKTIHGSVLALIGTKLCILFNNFLWAWAYTTRACVPVPVHQVTVATRTMYKAIVVYSWDVMSNGCWLHSCSTRLRTYVLICNKYFILTYLHINVYNKIENSKLERWARCAGRRARARVSACASMRPHIHGENMRPILLPAIIAGLSMHA